MSSEKFPSWYKATEARRVGQVFLKAQGIMKGLDIRH